MKLQAIFVATFFLLFSGSQALGQAKWKHVLDGLRRADQGLQTATATVDIDHLVQRPGESELTLVIKSEGKIWFDAPCYRLELRNEVRLRANREANDYLDRGIKQHTIVFDGKTTCEKFDYNDGRLRKIDHDRQFNLPILFAGFPVTEPLHVWKGPLLQEMLDGEPKQLRFLNSGGLKAELSTRNRRVVCSAWVLPDSNRIRRIEWPQHSKYPLNASCNLKWGESNGVPYVKRFTWDTISGNSEFGNLHRSKRTIEFTDVQAGVAIDPECFTFASLTDSRK